MARNKPMGPGRKLDLGLPDGPIAIKYWDFVHNWDFVGHLFVSPYAGAKSTALVDCMYKSGIEYPGARLLLAGHTLTDLKKSTIPKLEERLGAGFESENKNEAIYRFPLAPHPLTGNPVQSEIRCLGVDRHNIEDVMKSTEFFRTFIEEANTVPSDAHDVTLARTRQFAYHRELTVRHLLEEELQRWKDIHYRETGEKLLMTVEDIFHIFRDSEGSPIAQKELELDSPMPGKNGVKAVMNPHGNDHVWMRYVGIPFPEGGVSPEWADENVGVREFYFGPEDREEVRAPLIVGNYVQHRETKDYHIVTEKLDDHELVMLNGDVLQERDVDLVMQVNTTYGFPDENMSRNYANHQNSLLMMNRGLRKRTFGGIVDPRAGLVFRNFVPRPATEGGHVFPEPDELPGGLIGIGGIDVGGNHSHAAALGFITKQSKTVVLFAEYLKSGVSSATAAYEIQALIPPGFGHVQWMMDPSAWRKTYTDDLTDSHAMKYIEAGFHVARADKGDEAFDAVMDLLEYQDTWATAKRQARLYVMESCPMIIEAMSTVTWKDIHHGRHKWQVDMADAIKYLVSGLGAYGEVAQVPEPKGRLVYGGGFVR